MSSANRWMRGVEARHRSVRRRGEAGGDRPPDGARRLARGRARRGPGARREQRRVDERGQERAERPGERVRAALDAAVGVEQARGVQAGRCSRAAASARERVAAGRSVSGFSSTVTGSRHALEREVVGGAEAGVVAALDHFGAVRRARAPRRRRRGRRRPRSSCGGVRGVGSSARELGAASGAGRSTAAHSVTARRGAPGGRTRVADVERRFGAAAGGGGGLGVGEHGAQRCAAASASPGG